MVRRLRHRIARSLRLRFAASIAILVAVVGGSVAVVGVHVLEDALIEAHATATARVARHVAEHHRRAVGGDPQELLAASVAHSADLLGAAVYESRPDSPAWSRVAVVGDVAVPVLLTEVPDGEEWEIVRAADGEELVTVTHALDGGRRAIRVVASIAPIQAVAERARNVLFALAGLLVALGALFGDRVGQGWLTPLRNLLDAMRDVTNGRLGRRLDTTHRDELGFLTRRFNMMARSLERYRDEAEKHAADLERSVRDRTAELERANLSLRTLDRAKDAFLSNVSHEMRTPLTSIMASIEILRDFGEMDNISRRDFLSIIDTESQRLLGLIERVLEIVALEAAPMVLDCATHCVDDMVDDSISHVALRASSRDVTILLHSERSGASSFCDRERIERVLDGILDNAIKFSPRGGTIDVRVQAQEEEISIRVRDEGPGLDPAHAEGVFSKFVQVGESLTEKPQGFGLGLPLARRIAEAHGGTIRYWREQGFGATFELTLPRRSIRPESSTPAATESGLDLGHPLPASKR